MYLTYDEYTSMGGTLEEVHFSNFEFQAEASINYYTFGRLKGDSIIPIEVKRLMKYLVDLMEKKAAAFSLGKSDANSDVHITSQSNDGVSISYNGLAPDNLIELCKEDILTNVRNYLEGVTNEAGRKLLYRGVYPGE